MITLTILDEAVLFISQSQILHFLRILEIKKKLGFWVLVVGSVVNGKRRWRSLFYEGGTWQSIRLINHWPSVCTSYALLPSMLSFSGIQRYSDNEQRKVETDVDRMTAIIKATLQLRRPGTNRMSYACLHWSLWLVDLKSSLIVIGLVSNYGPITDCRITNCPIKWHAANR